MKIAICLYGQPRHYKSGYNQIKNFIENNKECSFDIFFHCWTLKDKGQYLHSPWRSISIEEYKVDNMETIKDNLIDLYKPILFKFEESITNFEISDSIKNSIAYKNSNSSFITNFNNTLSQCYSRTQVRNLLNEYIKTTNTQYDMVTICRFDFIKPINFKFDSIEKDKVYVSNLHCPRKIIPDNFIIAPTNIF